MRALAKANELRTSRANVKADLRAGRVSLVDVLTDPPAELEALPLWELLRLVRKFGVERSAQLNRRAIAASVNLAVPLGRASERTRDWLVAALNGTATTPDESAQQPLAPRIVLAHDPRAEQLAQAIEAHRVGIRGPSPTTQFGIADDLLYQRCAGIMATVEDAEAA